MAIMLYSFRMERGWYYVNAGCDGPFSLRFKVCFIFCHFTGAFILWLKYFVYDLTFKMKEFDMNSTPYKKWLQWFIRPLIECDNQEVPMVMCLHLLWVWLRRNPADLNGAVFRSSCYTTSYIVLISAGVHASQNATVRYIRLTEPVMMLLRRSGRDRQRFEAMQDAICLSTLTGKTANEQEAAPLSPTMIKVLTAGEQWWATDYFLSFNWN